MAEITLYTHERPGAGLTSIDVCRVKGALALRIVTERMIRYYPLTGNQSDTIFPQPSTHPANGKADLRLQIAIQGGVNLAKCKWAVALVVVEGLEGNNTTIYWINDRQCSEIEQCSSSAWARAEIEGRCCPQGYELPPQMG
jgi:hypothetical protein